MARESLAEKVDIQTLPTMYDLPSEDPEEPGLPDQFHQFQPNLLQETFQPKGARFFAGMDMNLYYDVNHTLWYKRPDWFVALGVNPFYGDREDLRLSYVVWQEEAPPYLVVELLSPGTEKEDMGQGQPSPPGSPPDKWTVYEKILGVPYYVVYDRYANQWHPFVLDGGTYRPAPLQDGRLWLPETELYLGRWQGTHENHRREWLRFFDATGRLIPTKGERAEQLAEKLRSLGIDPDSV